MWKYSFPIPPINFNIIYELILDFEFENSEILNRTLEYWKIPAVRNSMKRIK